MVLIDTEVGSSGWNESVVPAEAPELPHGIYGTVSTVAIVVLPL